MSTQTEAKHIDTPWRVGDAGHTVFGPPNGMAAPAMVAQLLKREDAAFIVKCVNSHEALIALAYYAHDKSSDNDVREYIKKTIQQAEGK